MSYERYEKIQRWGNQWVEQTEEQLIEGREEIRKDIV